MSYDTVTRSHHIITENATKSVSQREMSALNPQYIVNLYYHGQIIWKKQLQFTFYYFSQATNNNRSSLEVELIQDCQ